MCYGWIAETIALLLPLMRPAELRRVLKIEDEPATAQRLGFVLENLKATNLAKIVQDWLCGGAGFGHAQRSVGAT